MQVKIKITMSKLKSGGSFERISWASSSIISAELLPVPDDDCLGRVSKMLPNN